MFDLFYDAYTSIRDFFEQGGDVLYGILFVTICLWTLIVERFWYFSRVWPEKVADVRRRWENRADQESWYAKRIRDQFVSEMSLSANSTISIIKALIAVLPLLGLLGTVTGMIDVFAVMSVFGTGNARAMAGGVSKATIPTMSGMVAALSGLWFSAHLEKKARVEVERAADNLRHF